MGLKAIELALPAGGPGPTALTPAAQNTVCKFFRVARTDTVSSLKAVIPAQCSPYAVSFIRNGVSDAATSASITITISDQTGVLSTGSYDVKASGAVSGSVQMTNLPILEGQPLTGDKQITAVYAEAGTASTTGGPWIVALHYV